MNIFFHNTTLSSTLGYKQSYSCKIEEPSLPAGRVTADQGSQCRCLSQALEHGDLLELRDSLLPHTSMPVINFLFPMTALPDTALWNFSCATMVSFSILHPHKSFVSTAWSEWNFLDYSSNESTFMYLFWCIMICNAYSLIVFSAPLHVFLAPWYSYNW